MLEAEATDILFFFLLRNLTEKQLLFRLFFSSLCFALFNDGEMTGLDDRLKLGVRDVDVCSEFFTIN